MATERQNQLIRDLEAAAAAVRAEHIDEWSVTLNLICEKAGWPVQNVRSMIDTMIRNEEMELLERAHAAFELAGKVPAWFEQGGVVFETSKKGPQRPETVPTDLPPTAAERTKRIQQSVAQQAGPAPVVSGDSELGILEAVNSVIKTLQPFTQFGRQRILGTSAHFFGVGE